MQTTTLNGFANFVLAATPLIAARPIDTATGTVRPKKISMVRIINWDMVGVAREGGRCGTAAERQRGGGLCGQCWRD